jgi:PASTA domain
MRAGRRTVLLIGAAVVTLAGCASPLADVPDVDGAAADEAVAELEAQGFAVEYTGGHRPEEDAADRWLVSSQRPQAGRGPAGAKVKLEVASVLEVAATRCDIDGAVGDEGASLELDMEGDDFGSGDLNYADVACVLNELDVPDSVVSKMDSTRSIDGRQTEDWDGIEANWTYHPDDGLDVILELKG